MGYPNYNHRMDEALAVVGGDLANMSRWIDEHPANKARTPLENLLLRTSVKMHEEKGEVNAALIGMTDQNPRKRTTHTMEDVEAELLDWAVVALGAVEHIHGNDGSSMIRLADKISKIVARMEAKRAETAKAIADLKASAEDPEFQRRNDINRSLFYGMNAPGEAKGCGISYYNSTDTSITHCTFKEGHDRVSPGGQNKTLFDHGNEKARTYWDNDSKFLTQAYGSAPPDAKDFFDKLQDEAEQAVRDNPEIYNEDGTAR